MKTWILFLTAFMLGSPAWAQKLNFDFGYYSIQADPSLTASGTSDRIQISGPGVYALSGNFELPGPFEVGIGYTVFFSKLISGDMGFGPDFSLIYFPLNRGFWSKSDTPQLQYREIEKIRPFAKLSFHQRQFQSAQSAFSGFGIGAGVEYQYAAKSALRAQVRTMSLLGPSNSRLTYVDLMLGLQFQFY